ncbi:hypothetical protein CBM2633_U10102 [Cupriavidus taiwanensis]|nr:hypothetical protein CBM2633_U10102 [Cupriavidus taiwanensis]
MVPLGAANTVSRHGTQQNRMQICPAAEDGDDFTAMFCDQAGEICCVSGPAGVPERT